MTILGIETSCDDTAISLIKIKNSHSPSFAVISNLISSQTDIHRQWGGIYPKLARREHQKNLLPLFKQALLEGAFLKKGKEKIKKEIKEILKKEEILQPVIYRFLKQYQKPPIDLIALTVGPGLDPSLWVGINFAKALSGQWQIPIVPVNHLEAHLIISLFSFKNNLWRFQTDACFPAMGLIVSGGHTQLVLIKELGQYEIVGETRDDAAGECFDKAARILGLGYPGGPAIAAAAKKVTTSKTITPVTPLPRPMIKQKNLDFSFSGLKTALFYRWQKQSIPSQISAEAKEVQQAIIEVLITKTARAIEKYQVKALIVGGGVMANEELRRQLSEKIKVKIFFPQVKESLDNALMISITGYLNRKKSVNYDKIQASPNFKM